MTGKRTYRAQGIVLMRTALSEKDYIVLLLLSSGSLLQAVAKGARRPGSKLAGRVELFCETDFLIAPGKSLDIIVEAHTTNAHLSLRDFERTSAASAVLEIARLTAFEDNQDAFVYPLLQRTLRALEEAQTRAHIDVVLAAYTFKVTAHGGWRPHINSCVLCGDEHISYFSSAHGGTLCDSCAHKVEGAYPITAVELGNIASLVSSIFDKLLDSTYSKDDGIFLAGLAHGWAATQLDTRLKAFEFYMSL